MTTRGAVFTSVMLLFAPCLVGAVWWSIGQRRAWSIVTAVCVTVVLVVAAAVGMRLA